MDYVEMGRSGIQVSRLCFGTLTIGPLQAGLPLEEGGSLVAEAIRRGVTFFDTAQLYETYPYLREGMRRAGKQDCVISSKTYAYTRELAAEAVEQARRELGRDYIDIFLLHEQESYWTLRGHREALDYLLECKGKGIIRAVGCSTHHIAAVRGAVKMGLDIVHPLINADGLGIVDGSREEMEQAIQEAARAGLGIFSMKALGGGNLFRDAPRCLAYILSKPYIHAVAVGMQRLEELGANIAFFETGRFPPEAEQALKAKKRRLLIDDWCEGCGSCVRRCPQGAMSVINGKAVCDPARCVLCGYCSAVCPAWAIKVI